MNCEWYIDLTFPLVMVDAAASAAFSLVRDTDNDCLQQAGLRHFCRRRFLTVPPGFGFCGSDISGFFRISCALKNTLGCFFCTSISDFCISSHGPRRLTRQALQYTHQPTTEEANEMKNTITNTMKNGLIMSTALITGVLAIGSAFTQVQAQDNAALQSVTIVAKRMSEEQKIAFDTAQDPAHVVMISAKRLTAEQKMAMDREDQFERSQLAEKTPARRHVQG
ncbi:hypothetical protein ACO0LM_17500 [Undibacterium sp. Di26W]|uniref:hypothetical protein n=1 Tax=Undibacterium sp. Di26W TaxID=3413035 RepID=UPI003BF27190